MIILEHKNELLRYFIYIFALLLSLFIISNVIIKDTDKTKIDVEKSIINNGDDLTKIYVEYPRFKDDKINGIITNYIYSYIKTFKNSSVENKALDITYDLYYIDEIVNVTFHIENTLSNVKTKNILLNLKNKTIEYITNLYDEEYLRKAINDLVYYKYSSDIYNSILNSSLNNYTYILSDSKIDVYFNDIKFNNIDYIPYIEIYFDSASAEIQDLSQNTKFISFTYDDGPSNYTRELLKTLETNNSSATFFMIGNRMKKYQDIVLDIYNSNSEIGSHSYAHKDLSKLSIQELNEDLDKTNLIFNSITNDNLKYLRPPYNYMNENVLNSAYNIITWNIDPKDWLVKDSTKIYNSVIKNACDGCIVIMHDIYPTTIEATKMLLPKLNEMGYQVVSISKLIEIKNYVLNEGVNVTKIK